MSHRSGTPRPEQLPPPAEPIAPGDDLIEAFRRTGLPADFERVVRRYAPLVFAECRRVTRDGHDAEDAAQLTFLALAIELRGGTDLRKPAAWLQRVAQRQSLKLVRSRGRRRKREDAARKLDQAPLEPLRLEIAEREQHAGQVRDAIDELPERYRLPLVLHYFGGLSLEAIAAELGIKRQAVGTRLFRARKMLAERLDERGITMHETLLATLVATLVPAAVIANLMKAGAPVVAQTVPGASFAQGIATIVGLAAGGRKPAVAAAVFITTATATGFAWVAPPKWIEAVRTTLDPTRWTRTLTETSLPRPSLVPLKLPSPIADATPPSAPRAFPATPAAPPMPSPMATAATPARTLSTTNTPTLPTIAAALQSGPFEIAVGLAPPPAALARIDVGWQPWRSSRSDRGTSERSSSQAVKIDRPVTLTGTASVDSATIGLVGAGSLDLAGGKLKVGGLTLGAGVGSSGTLQVGSGTVEVTQPESPVVVGGLGVGKLYLGTQDAPGQIVASPGADVRLIVRATERANGLIRGWGTVDAGGSLVNNGRIIADGFERNRSLNLSHFQTVTNTIDNPHDGTNGWYARRGGRVVLPTLHFDAHRQTATWGESDDDPTIDLVNSVRVTAADQARPGSMKVTLQTVGLHDAASPMPFNVHVIGLYDIESTDLDGNVTFSVRYDHAAAGQFVFGESSVRLLGRENGTWVAATAPSLSRYHRIVNGTFNASIDALAVVGGSMLSLVPYPPEGYRFIASSVGVNVTELRYASGAGLPSVPEPATWLAMMLGAAGLLRRTRR